MSWPIPKFTKGEINRAGEILADRSQSVASLEWAEEVLGNWRACHGYPINTFQKTLRDKLRNVDPAALVAQR